MEEESDTPQITGSSRSTWQVTIAELLGDPDTEGKFDVQSGHIIQCMSSSNEPSNSITVT